MTCRVDNACSQRPSCIRRSLCSFLISLSLAGGEKFYLMGPELLSATLLTTSYCTLNLSTVKMLLNVMKIYLSYLGIIMFYIVLLFVKQSVSFLLFYLCALVLIF